MTRLRQRRVVLRRSLVLLEVKIYVIFSFCSILKIMDASCFEALNLEMMGASYFEAFILETTHLSCFEL